DFARADKNDSHAGLRRQLMHRGGATRAPPGHRLRQQFFAGRNLAPAYRRSTAGTEIIENLPIGQDEKQPLAHWHRGFALLAVQA
ncbi:MAG TPA: hypothetical protein VJ248_01180, partial [Candidatus Udaeobacter sp.]|nr:hypothetical protein [Candidatus Udaeobacter sp.]